MTPPRKSASVGEASGEMRDRWLAIAENWLTKAYPRGWQRQYVARGIVDELLSDLQRADEPRDASAHGFYHGDRVLIEPEGLTGYIEKVFGPDSHAVEVRCDGGMMAPVEDFDLTRID